MTRVAKAIIIDQDNNYLIMRRSNHPTFGNDPDLPGGTAEEGETPLTTMVREVFEETAIHIDGAQAHHLYTGAEYSNHNTEYSLYYYRVATRPQVTMSWEHTSYAWVDRDEFLRQTGESIDTYMHMTHDIVKEKLVPQTT